MKASFQLWCKTENESIFWLMVFFFPNIGSLFVLLATLIYFIPLRSIWFAAMSMTLMMNAIAKAQIRLLRTHVCFSCCVGLAVKRFRKRKTALVHHSVLTQLEHVKEDKKRGNWLNILSMSTWDSGLFRWFSSVMMMFSMSFMVRWSRKVSYRSLFSSSTVSFCMSHWEHRK